MLAKNKTITILNRNERDEFINNSWWIKSFVNGTGGVYNIIFIRRYAVDRRVRCREKLCVVEIAKTECSN